MQSSTFYANDQVGCITLNVSTANSSDKLNTSFNSVKLFGANPFNNGEISSKDYSLSYDTSGVLDQRTLGIKNNFYKVLATDYSTYAVVYECTSDPVKLLNWRNDDIHILARAETVTSADLDTWKALAETVI